MSSYSNNGMKNSGFSFQRKYDTFIKKEERPRVAKRTCSDSYFGNYSFKQLKTLAGDLPPNHTDGRNSDAANIGRKYSRTRAASPQVKVPLIDSKTFRKFTKQRVTMTKAEDVAVNGGESTHNTDAHRCHSESALRSNKTVSFNLNVKQTKKCMDRCNSLTDLRMAANSCAVSPFSRFSESSLPLSPSRTFVFEDKDSKSQKKNTDYLKQFDYTCNYGLFNYIELDEYGRDFFSLAPNLLPLPKAIALKRGQYKCGILSADDSANTEEGKSVKSESKATVSFEFHDNSDIYSTASSDYSDCIGDSKSLGGNASNENLLIIDKPIRIKCIDEVTEQTIDVIIYTDEFLKNMLKECGETSSKQEILENILRRSTNYNGKSLRILQEAEIFLKDCKKSQSSFKLVGQSKIPTIIPSKLSSTEFSKKNRIWSASPRSKSFHTLTAAETPPGLQHERKSRFAKSTVDLRQYAAKSRSPSRLSIPNSMKFSLSRKQEGETEACTSKPDGGKKSRAALKRVNVEEITASDFRHYFHFYAMLGQSKCGAAINKWNSILWLKKCGIVDDKLSEKAAESCFTITAKTKCILNISDYVQFLILIAKNKGMFLVDVIEQLMSIHPQSVRRVIAAQRQAVLKKKQAGRRNL